MKEQIRYRINPEIKMEYTTSIEQKHGMKHANCGKTVENLMKLYLSTQGNYTYIDDPDVQELLRLSAEKYHSTHTQSKDDSNSSDDGEEDVDQIEKLEQKMEKMQETIEQLQVQLVKAISQEPPKKGSDNYRQMDSFVSKFQEEYGEYHQVSMKEIQKLVIKEHGVADKRSIQNRVNYLQGKGIIESYAPNVYNVKL